TGIISRKATAHSAASHILWRMFSLMSLTQEIFDVITSHLRFADKYFFQGERERFYEQWLLRLGLLQGLRPFAADGQGEERAGALHFQDPQTVDQLLLPAGVGDHTLQFADVILRVIQIPGE